MDNFISLTTDETVMKFVETDAFDIEKAKNLWSKLLEEFYPQGKNTIYAVFGKNENRYIGHAAIRPRAAKPEDWEISNMLRTLEWDKDFATEIARGLIEFGFGDLNLSEVFATIDDNNFNSIKVAEKAGTSFLRHEFDEEGRFSVYSIKSSEFQL